MTVTALDTHEVVKELKAAGFSDNQAEAVTRVLRRSQEVDVSNLVTKTEFQLAMAASKADLQTAMAGAKADLQSAMAGAKADLQTAMAGAKADLAETKAEILKWMVGSMGVQTTVILGAIATLLHLFAR